MPASGDGTKPLWGGLIHGASTVEGGRERAEFNHPPFSFECESGISLVEGPSHARGSQLSEEKQRARGVTEAAVMITAIA